MLKIFEAIFWLAVLLFCGLIALAVLGKAFPVLLAYGIAALAHDAAMSILPRYKIMQHEKVLKFSSALVAAAFFIPIADDGWQMVPNISNRMDSTSCASRGCD